MIVGTMAKDSKFPGTQKKGKAAAEVCELHEERREQTRQDMRWRDAAMDRAA